MQQRPPNPRPGAAFRGQTDGEAEKKAAPRPEILRPDPENLCDLAHMADEPQSTDVLGSYTGTAKDGGHPVQDADDL